jgi:hypothetical protein
MTAFLEVLTRAEKGLAKRHKKTGLGRFFCHS